MSPTWGFKSLHLHQFRIRGKAKAFSLFCNIRLRLSGSRKGIEVPKKRYNLHTAEYIAYSHECKSGGKPFTHNTGVKACRRLPPSVTAPPSISLYTESTTNPKDFKEFLCTALDGLFFSLLTQASVQI